MSKVGEGWELCCKTECFGRAWQRKSVAEEERGRGRAWWKSVVKEEGGHPYRRG